MKKIILLIIPLLLFLVTGDVYSQSSILFDSGTALDITSPADICADVITINGSHSGDGTKCNSSFGLVLNLTALLEATWVSGGETAMTMAPNVMVELHDGNTKALVESKTSTLSKTGLGTLNLTIAANGTPYYVVVKSANTTETWSATAQSFTAGALNYDFTTGTAQAYTDGSNPSLADHSGKFCIYSGDVNQDGFITGDDFQGVDNDASNFNFHVANDVNGDGFVTGDDFQFIDNNASIFVQRQVPPGAPDIAAKKDIKSRVQQKELVK